MKTIKIKTTGLSLLELLEKYGTGSAGFYKDNTWWKNQAFAKEKPEAGEYEFDFTSRHCGNNHRELKEILEREGFDFPHPAVLAEAILSHYKNKGERLLEDWWSRTSVLGSDGGRVSVGIFDAVGLGVRNVWGGLRDSRLGVSASRKVPGTLESLDPVESPDPTESLNRAIEVVKKSGYKVIKEI